MNNVALSRADKPRTSQVLSCSLGNPFFNTEQGHMAISDIANDREVGKRKKKGYDWSGVAGRGASSPTPSQLRCDDR